MKAAAKKKQQLQRQAAAAAFASSNLSQTLLVKPTDENDLALQIEKARNGSHDELIRRKSIIERDIEKKIVAADRFRKLQLKNINDLYDFEIISLQSQCQKAFTEMEEKFVDELQSQFDNHKIRSKHHTNKNNNNSNANDASGNNGNGEHSAAVTVTAERSLRSVNAAAGKDGGGGGGGLDWANLLKDKEGNVSNTANATRPASKRRAVNPPNPLAMLEKTLDEKDVRSDFLFIVKDLEQRASQFNKRPKIASATATAAASTVTAAASSSRNHANVGNTAQQPVMIRIDAMNRLIVDGFRYAVGDAVQVYSLLCDETFLGVITAIDSEEVILRSVTGPRFSFPLRLIKTGRVTLQQDAEYAAQILSTDAILPTLASQQQALLKENNSNGNNISHDNTLTTANGDSY